MEKRARLLSLIARLILGGIFIYGSIDKIAHPASFAKAVSNYQILPDILINPTAIVLPWLELVLGILLVTGLFQEGSVSLATLLLMVFLCANVFNLARGFDIDCGCFSTSLKEGAHAPMMWYVFRGSLFLIPALYLSYHTFRTRQQEVAVQHTGR